MILNRNDNTILIKVNGVLKDKRKPKGTFGVLNDKSKHETFEVGYTADTNSNYF